MTSSSTAMLHFNSRMAQLFRQIAALKTFCLTFQQAHKLFLAVASPVFEGMFFGPLADKGLREVIICSVLYALCG